MTDDWEPGPPDGGEDPRDHPDRGPEWDGAMPGWCGPTAQSWGAALRGGGLGVGWADGPIAVGARALGDALGRPAGADRAWEIQLGRDLRGLCPGVGHVRRRRPASAGGALEYAYVLPRLGECRSALAAWIARGRAYYGC